MDEEQPKKKITLNNFFEQIVEIDKVANAALTNSNMVQSQLNAIQLDLKRLVESLQVNFDSGVQNVQTQINEVTNVIVQEQGIKKSETDALEEEIFTQEDRLQKQAQGKKATSSDGNLIQKAISSVENKAKSNLLATGLFASSFLLAGIKPPKPNKKNKRGSAFKNKQDVQDGDENLDLYTEDKSQGDDTAVEGGYTISRENLTTDQNIKLDNLQYGNTFPAGSFSIQNDKKISTNNITNNIVNNNVIQEIVEKKKPDLVKRNNELFNKRKKELINRLKYDPREVIAAAKKSYEEGGTGMAGYNEETGKIEVTSKEELQAEKEAVLSAKAGVQPDGGYNSYAANTVYSEFRGFDDGPVSNNVIDGGTTIIEGNNEVVNEDISSGQGRGEVATDVSIVKSSNSPVSAVAIAEGNSLNNLTI